MLRRRWIQVEGKDSTPDGYRDYLMWEGRSWWQALRAVRAGLKEGQEVVVVVYLPDPDANY